MPLRHDVAAGGCAAHAPPRAACELPRRLGRSFRRSLRFRRTARRRGRAARMRRAPRAAAYRAGSAGPRRSNRRASLLLPGCSPGATAATSRRGSSGVSSSRRLSRRFSASRQTRATTVVSQPSRFATCARSARLTRSQLSCSASSDSAADPDPLRNAQARCRRKRGRSPRLQMTLSPSTRHVSPFSIRHRDRRSIKS